MKGPGSPPDGDRADRLPVAKHRHRDQAPDGPRPVQLSERVVGILRTSESGPALFRIARPAAVPPGRPRKDAPQAPSPSRLDARERHELSLAVDRKTTAESASQGARLLAMASNTGWTSVGELEMTRRISPVAVCCSSAR